MIKKYLDATGNKYTDKKIIPRQSLWQRITNAKSVRFYVERDCRLRIKEDLLLDKISMFTNIEKIDCKVYQEHMSILTTVMQQCSENIRYFKFEFANERKYLMSSLMLKLLNAEHVEISNVGSYVTSKLCVIFSKKCQYLHLSNVSPIDEDWCNFMIDNCDCSGIKHLIMDKTELVMDLNVDGGKRTTSNTLEKFAKQFINIEKFDLGLVLDSCQSELELWSLLKPIIEKNNTYVTLLECEYEFYAKKDQMAKLRDFIRKEEMKVDDCKMKDFKLQL